MPPAFGPGFGRVLFLNRSGWNEKPNTAFLPLHRDSMKPLLHWKSRSYGGETGMKFQNPAVALTLLAVMSLAGCDTTDPNQRAGGGALIGAGAGALAGQAIGGNTKSTIVGAAGGALLGAVVGTATTPQSQNQNCRYQRPDGSIYIAPC
jgi:hypothetical protein